MQEMINFKILVNKKTDEVVAKVKDFFDEFKSLLDDGHIELWTAQISYGSTIENHSECKMYSFDYDEIFPDLIENISQIEDAAFSGIAEYTNDEGVDFSSLSFQCENGVLDIQDTSPCLEISVQEKVEHLAKIRDLIEGLSIDEINYLCVDFCIDRTGNDIEDIYNSMIEESIDWGEPVEVRIDGLCEYIEDNFR